VAGRAREHVRRVRVTNALTNPRGVALTNWGIGASVGPTNFTSGDRDDATFKLGKAYAANGHCGWFSADMQGTNQGAFLTPGKASNGAGQVTTVVNQVVFGRCRMKVVQCQPDSTLQLFIRFSDSTGATNVVTKLVHTVYPVNTGDVVWLEGFCLATNVRACLLAQFLASGPSPVGHVEVSVGNAQLVVEPEGDVPGAVDGYVPSGGWDGTVDASSSFGYVYPNQHDPESFAGGFNYFHIYHDDSPADAAQICDYLLELGQTHLRLSVGSDAALGGVDLVWPEGQASPDWSVSAVAPFIAELRRRGLHYLPIHMLPCTWMTTDGSYNPALLDPTYLDDFVRLHTSLVDYAPDVVDSIELWNEPNLVATAPGGGLTPAAYTALQIPIYDGVKASHPNTKIIAGCLARYQSDDASGTSILTYLEGMYAAGAKGKMDAISVHPYSDDISTSDPTSTGQFHSGFDLCMRQVRQVRHAHADDATPVWVTEYGWNLTNGGSERSQMQAMALWRGRLARAPDVDAAFFHTIFGDHTMGASVRGYGLLDLDDHRRRPAFTALSRDGIAVGARWRTLALLNSWVGTNGAVVFPLVVRFRKDGDTVEVRGAVTKTTGAANDQIGTLPDGFIPFETVDRTVAIFNGSTWGMGVVRVNGRAGANAGKLAIVVGGSIAAGNINELMFSFVADG
jgi:hypothetical protein